MHAAWFQHFQVQPDHSKTKNAGPAWRGPAASTVAIITVALAGICIFRGIDDEFSRVVKPIAICCGLVAVLFCLMCHFIDPGAPSRNPNDLAPANVNDDNLRIRTCYLADGRPWKQKWCRPCSLWRPSGCGHCQACGRCVLRLDHHCFWVGTCIGEQNMRFFACFLFSCGMGLMLIVVLASHRIYDVHNWNGNWEPLILLAFIFYFPPSGRSISWLATLFCGGVGFMVYMALGIGQLYEAREIPFSYEVWTILLFIMLLPPNPQTIGFGGVALAFMGIAYVFAMLADLERIAGATFTQNVARIDFFALMSCLKCRGIKSYCFGPITWRRKLHSDTRDLEKLPEEVEPMNRHDADASKASDVSIASIMGLPTSSQRYE